MPKTGERVRKSFTLRGAVRGLNQETDDGTPLLGHIRSSSSHGGGLHAWTRRVRAVTSQAYQFTISTMGQSILKCSLAYLIGSLATFVGPIAALLGVNDGKHIVATVTVYFHPARSAGSMLEAVVLALIAFSYAAFVSLTSMAVSAFFGRHGLLALGHAIVLVVFCGGGLGLVGWLKQRLGSPLVNVACSLTSLAIITVLTKEGAVQAATFSYVKVFQVLKMVIMGIIASTVVSLLIRPVSARKELREDLRKATDSLGVMLTAITRSFLSGCEEDLQHSSFVVASAQYKSVFNRLTKNLGESKWEHYFLGTEKEFRTNARLVRCLERLSQNIGGLRSAATTQFTLIKKSPDNESFVPVAIAHTPHGSSESHPSSSNWSTVLERMKYLSSIEEAPEGGASQHDGPDVANDQSEVPREVTTAASTADIFSLFIAYLGPSMVSLEPRAYLRQLTLIEIAHLYSQRGP